VADGVIATRNDIECSAAGAIIEVPLTISLSCYYYLAYVLGSEVSWRMCMSVCLICTHISGTTCPIFAIFLCKFAKLPMALQCLPLAALRYVVYFRFYGWRCISAWTGHKDECWCGCSGWRHCVVVRRLTPLLRRVVDDETIVQWVSGAVPYAIMAFCQ